MEIKDAITTAQAAKILGLDPSAIRHRILAGTLAPWEKQGHTLFVSKKIIEAEARKKSAKNGKDK